MSMMNRIAWSTLVGIVAIGAGRAAASQPLSQIPVAVPRAVAPQPATPEVPARPTIAPGPEAPMAIVPALPPMPPMPMMPALDYAPIAQLPAMPELTVDVTRALVEAKTAFKFALAGSADDREDQLYDRAREAIENGRYERALEDLNRLIALNGVRVDAALYWKAYSLVKIGHGADALTTVADMEQRFKDSRWIKDAKVLAVEVRRAAGQTVSPESQTDEELKVMALTGLMQSDPERALPMIEKILAGSSSIKLKERALFALTQSRSARAREIIAGVAKGSGNPDLQLRAIRYIGMMGVAESRQILDEAYRSTPDPAVKRTIIRSFMTSNDRARLLALAKTEKDNALRGDAVQQLGNMRATTELLELYQSEQSLDIRKRILQGLFVGGASDKLIEVAKAEKDPDLRRTAIRNLGNMRRTEASDALIGIYASDSNVEVRKAIISALFNQGNAKALVDIARGEKNIELKKDIVSKLSNMKSKEAADYMLEILK